MHIVTELRWPKIVVGQVNSVTSGIGVWGVCVPTVGGSPSPSGTPPSQRLSCAPCGVAPSTAATEQEGWCPMAGHVRGHAACGLWSVLECACLSGSVSESWTE